MLFVWMGKCAPIDPYLPFRSLNEPVEAVAEEGDDPDAEEELVDRIADPTVDVEAEAARRQLLRRLPKFMNSLPERLKEVARRHYWGGMSAIELAQARSVDRSTVHRDLNEISRLGRKFFGVREH
jgi:DNA-directed RNA polymerase specialized sigma24 family protein